MSDKNIPGHLFNSLNERQQKGTLRKLTTHFPSIDFCSNDYLGFSKLGLLSKKLETLNVKQETIYGSTGSRLISGNSIFIEEAEKQITLFHHAESALLFNSGYDANLGFFSSVPQKEDLVLYDELIHASVHDGIKLGRAKHFKFAHNNIAALNDLIQRHQEFQNIYIIVESVYSMDGDNAPLVEIIELIKDFETIFLIVDEAHAIGVFGNQGRGLCNELGIEDKCFARIYTYGKAMGCHGAAIVGSNVLRNYLINFARSFIYTTALPNHCIHAILGAYQLLIETHQQQILQNNISYFYKSSSGIKHKIESHSAIQSIVAGNNEMADELEKKLVEKNIYAKAIKSPTVKPGTERVRFCIHAFNTKEEIDLLIQILSDF